LLGVLLVRSGNTIEIASGVFEVAPGCSGTNFLLCALSVSLLMGEIYSLRLRGRLALITTGIAIAMAANWFRIVTLVVLGDRTRMQSYLVAEEHYTFGWAAFAVALFAWILVVSRVLDKHREHTAEARSNSNADRIKSNGGNTIAAILALTIAAIGTVWIAAMADLPKSREPTMAEVLPAIPGWNGPLAEEGFWRPKFLGSDREWQGMYRSGGTDVLVYRNAYLSETPGRELVSSQNRLTPDGWQLRQTREGRIAIATEPTGEEWLIASWMLVGDGVADNAIRAKIMKAFYLLRRMPVPAGITVVATPCDDDCDAANAAVGSFLTAARWPEKSGMGESRNDLASDQANAP
jgi:EpsI family protein